jgi:uncharacterized protein YcnI
MDLTRDWIMKKTSRSFGVILRLAAQIGRTLIAFLLLSSITGARAVVFPTTSTPGAYEKYSLRVTNERDVPTLRVEINFPKGLRVISFG